jgi:hypothetical protein
MTGILTAIEFDKEGFPLSPYMQCFTIKEEFRRVVVTGYGDVSQSTNFNVPLDQTPAFLRGQPEGPYSLVVTQEGTESNPVITFSLKNLRSSDLQPIHHMPFRQFISDFETAYMEREDLLPDDLFETAWTAAYLHQRLGQIIEGNSGFWAKLHEELDMAIVPLQARMTMRAQNVVGKELVVQTRDLGEYPQARFG